MENLSKFESRVGKINSSSKAVYDFLNDMRNFKQFLPDGKVDNWIAEKDNCSFSVSPVGEARLRIIYSEPYSEVKYEGNGLNNTNFWLWVQLKQISEKDTRVKITIKADINPMIKMMASGPLNDFLDKLVSGMEKYSDW
jgi:carbon monoxide dehydrogenase subunit G